MKAWIQRAVSISLAARVSIVVAITMWALAAVTWWFYASDPTRIGWGSYMTFERGVALFTLWFICVAAVYAGIRVSMNDTPLGHAGARSAWRRGRNLLSRRGLNFSDIPMFLSLGGGTSPTAGSPSSRSGDGEDHGTDDERAADSSVDWHLQEHAVIANLRGLGRFEPSRSNSPSDRLDRHSDPPTHHAVATQTVATQTVAMPAAKDTVSSPEVSERATATVEHADEMLQEVLSQAQPQTAASPRHARVPSSPVESTRSLRRERGLTEFLQRLRRDRQPFATVNGVLAVVPSATLLPSRESDADRPLLLGRQLRHDLRLIRDTLGLEVPVTICVESPTTASPNNLSNNQPSASTLWGLHLDPAQRWDPASLSGLADRVVESVVERADDEMLAMVPDGQDRSAVIARNQRTREFAAECRELRSSLNTFLVEAFPSPDSAAHDLRLSGVFIDHPDRIFDVGGVMQVLQNQQHELEWTPTTRARQRNRLRLNLVLAGIGLMLIAAAYWQWTE